MNKKLSLAGLLVSLVFLASPLVAQEDPMAALKQNYPKVFGLFQDEMQNMHANYLFAVDVSGTMNRFSSTVIPAMKEFVGSLPDGDHVDIIRFGSEARAKDMGYTGRLEEKFKDDLYRAIDELYTNPLNRSISGRTDIPKMMAAVSNCLNGYKNNDLNFVFLLTDFLNEESGKQPGLISDATLNEIEQSLYASTMDKPISVVSLQLPYSGNMSNFCLPQIDGLFNKLDMDYVSVPVVSGSALSNWFAEQKKQVMWSRLHAIVTKANKEVKVDFDPEIDWDGNVSGLINWQPNKLYREIKVNDISVQDGSGFRFKSDKELTGNAIQDKTVELPLGRLKHSSWGFHKYNGDLLADIDLPTPFDEELRGLRVEKPVPSSSIPVDKFIFTFILPLWLTALLLALLVIYLFLVLGAAKRNRKESFTGSVEVYKGRNLVYENDSIRKKNLVNIPGDLNARGSASVDWALQLKKKPSNIFLFWKKPTYDLVATTGMVQDGSRARKSKKGMTPNYLRNRTIYCGIDSDHVDSCSVEFRKRS